MSDVRPVLRHALWIVAAAAMLALGFLALRRPSDHRAIAACRAAYQQARTAAETTMIHRMRPPTSAVPTTVALECQVYRQTGQLR